MTHNQAKTILALYRPGGADDGEAPLAEALALAREDPVLGEWFARHCQLQQSLQKSLRQLPVPDGLMGKILAGHKIVRPTFARRHRVALAAAAAILILAALTLTQLASRNGGRFENFRYRMVSTALLAYEMDIMTNRADALRAFLTARGAPGDYRVPDKLGALALTGGGVLRWRSHPVSMVCYDRGGGQMVFLFVINRSALSNPPAQAAQAARENKLQTLSWTEGEQTYVLAVPDEPGFEGKYR